MEAGPARWRAWAWCAPVLTTLLALWIFYAAHGSGLAATLALGLLGAVLIAAGLVVAARTTGRPQAFALLMVATAVVWTTTAALRSPLEPGPVGSVAFPIAHGPLGPSGPVGTGSGVLAWMAVVGDGLGYLLIGVALLVLNRGRNLIGRFVATLDSTLVAVVSGLALWMLVVLPNMPGTSDPPSLVSYLLASVADPVLFGMTVRLWAADEHRPPSIWLIGLSISSLLVGDVATLTGRSPGDSVVDWAVTGDSPWSMAWLAMAALMTMALLHPSFGMITSASRPHGSGLRGGRFAASLAFAMLTAPLLMVLTGSRTGGALVVVLVGSVTMFLLVTLRIRGILGSLRTSLSERAMAFDREQHLRQAAARFAATPQPASVVIATLATVRTLMGGSQNCVMFLGSTEPTGPDPAVRFELGDGQRVMATLVLYERPDETVSTFLDLLLAQAQIALSRLRLVHDEAERHSEERFQTLVQHSSDVIVVTRQDTVIRSVTSSVERVFGWTAESLVGRSLLDRVDPEDHEVLRAMFLAAPSQSTSTVRFRMRHADDRWLEVEAVGGWVSDPAVDGVLLTCRDVTERVQLEGQLRHQAFHDSLTGLANRALFTDRVSQALERSRRSGLPCAVLLCDVDDFKTVNDSLGHGNGDALLKVMAARIRNCIRAEDTAARFGGDEFAILVDNVESPEQAAEIAMRLLTSMREPVALADTQVPASASIGLVISDQTTEDVEALIRNADTAMYRSKAAGKAQVTLFEPDMHDRVLDRLRMVADLRVAVDEDQFLVRYQPIVTLVDGSIRGAEALIRWQHPVRGLLSPIEFVGVAEETGLIVEMGRAVLRAACFEAASWRSLLPDAFVSVNLSARQLQDPRLVDDVRRALEDADYPANQLTLELTESMLLRDSDATLTRLHELRALGVRLSIDDFGTGYSSLSYLRRYPINTLKIAKEFVDGVAFDSTDLGLVVTILELAESLGMSPVAEGIETTEQWAALRRVGCEYGQGYLFARPITAGEMRDRLAEPVRGLEPAG